MTRNTDELDVGCYVIGVFDILGQSRQLLRLTDFPPGTDEEDLRVARNLKEAVDAVRLFRRLFQDHFHERGKTLDEEASTRPEPQRTALRAALASSIVTWGLSDATVVAVPLMTGPTRDAAAAMRDVRRLLEAAAAAWLSSLAEDIPIRGGVEIGTAAQIGENEVYGPALVKAYRLESKVAKGPRIVVGEQLVATLESAHPAADPDFWEVAESAQYCRSLLRKDTDERTILDVLGGSWLLPVGGGRRCHDLFAKAHDNARKQLVTHENEGCEKLVSRYKTLLADFERQAPEWREQ